MIKKVIIKNNLFDTSINIYKDLFEIINDMNKYPKNRYLRQDYDCIAIKEKNKLTLNFYEVY